jgi:hypothetical protein
VTGCGCLLLIAALVGLIVFLIFGSTDPGEPIETAVALLITAWLLRRARSAHAKQMSAAKAARLWQRQALVPGRRALVRARDS